MTAKDYRKTARQALAGNRVSAVFTTVIAMALGGTVTWITPFVKLNYDKFKEPLGKAFGIKFTSFVSLGSDIWAWAVFLLGGVISVGFAYFFLELTKGRVADADALFARFKCFFRAFAVRFFKSVFTAVWSVLLIVIAVFIKPGNIWLMALIPAALAPAVIAAYGYALTPYILADEPKSDPLKVLGRSRAMMKGKKLKLFRLHLSFAGWILLCFLTLGVALIGVVPYIKAANAVFYRSVAQNYAQPGLKT